MRQQSTHSATFFCAFVFSSSFWRIYPPQEVARARPGMVGRGCLEICSRWQPLSRRLTGQRLPMRGKAVLSRAGTIFPTPPEILAKEFTRGLLMVVIIFPIMFSTSCKIYCWFLIFIKFNLNWLRKLSIGRGVHFLTTTSNEHAVGHRSSVSLDDWSESSSDLHSYSWI